MPVRKIRHRRITVCSPDYGVVEIETTGGHHLARHVPCAQCPWRMDNPTGVFPPDAFRTSAPTAFDAALSTFACHMSGSSKPVTCAGFLLRHSTHNLSVRLGLHNERIDLDRLSDGGYPIYPTYREMAVANGVPADDPSLAQIRGNEDEWDNHTRSWKAPE